jgi:lipoate-protein ligase B
VIYPIAFLPALGYPKRAARRFLYDLASSVRFYLQTLGLESELKPHPFGVYLPQGKIASFGVSLRNGVSSHGLAFYVDAQREFFEGIVPCGVADSSFTSLADQGIKTDWHTAASGLTDYIKRGFQVSKN